MPWWSRSGIRTINGLGHKYCPACDKTHPLEDFAKNKASKDGRYRICKAADAEWRKQRAAAIAARAPPVIGKGSPRSLNDGVLHCPQGGGALTIHPSRGGADDRQRPPRVP
jgi:hypothetical protein